MSGLNNGSRCMRHSENLSLYLRCFVSLLNRFRCVCLVGVFVAFFYTPRFSDAFLFNALYIAG